ncbi:MAG: hypothetical protein ACKOAU_03640 [Pirellula sp.]
MAKKKVAKKAASTGKAKTSTKKVSGKNRKLKITKIDIKRDDGVIVFPILNTIKNGEKLSLFLFSLEVNFPDYELSNVGISETGAYSVALPTKIDLNTGLTDLAASLTSEDPCTVVLQDDKKTKKKKKILAGRGKLTITIRPKQSLGTNNTTIDIEFYVRLLA